MVTRTEAAQVVKRANIEIATADLDRRKVREALKAAEKLEPNERHLVAVELATRIWLKHLKDEALYSEFEGFIWAYFSGKNRLEDHIRETMDLHNVGADALKIYCDLLRGMFTASGKTRNNFYGDMLVEEGIQMGPNDFVFGEGAMEFHEKIIYSVHKEHLLVFYSTRLLLKAFSAYYKGKNVVTKKMLKEIYMYFEENLPLSGKFSSYTIDDSFFKSGIESKCLPKL